MKIRFMGAAGVVTGSKTLVTDGRTRLLVDCGLFQGFKENRLRNWEALDTGPLDAVLLTHAHLDHSGYVPALVKQGYRGPVYCSPATASLLRILWPDSGRIQEEDASHANRHGASSHQPAEPLYDEADARRALERLVLVDPTRPLSIGSLQAHFRNAGHILGACSIELRSATHRLLFSGDLGRPSDEVVFAPAPPPAVDTLVMESTYGNRTHIDNDRVEALAGIVRTTAQRGGMVLIPAFAVGRAQSLLWSIHQLIEAGRIPRLDVVVDSPMAASATQAFLGHPDDLRLSPQQLHEMTQRVTFTETAEESKALNRRTDPFILIAASGMLTGGRVLHHIINRAGDPKNTLIFVGFQAPGTRGARLLSGDGTVRIYGRSVDVQCQVEEIRGYSAHADQNELIAWLASAPQRPRRVFLNHGEPEATDALRIRLREQGYEVVVATERQEWVLAAETHPVDASGYTRAAEVGLLRFARELSFSDDDDDTVDAVCAAIERIKSGAMPSIPLVIHGVPLAVRIRQTVPSDDLHYLSFDRR